MSGYPRRRSQAEVNEMISDLTAANVHLGTVVARYNDWAETYDEVGSQAGVGFSKTQNIQIRKGEKLISGSGLASPATSVLCRKG